ncbi:MAG: hypothetical protein HDS16_04765 [Bacteroides sp.]|nr:hypothetical protein [Bacteroides sp.]
MKILLNWRYYVMFVLLFVGIVSLLAVFGEDNRPVVSWVIARGYYSLSAIGSFYTLRRLRVYWESQDKIPEFTNQK